MSERTDSSTQLAEICAALIHTRRTTLPKRLGAPGPDAAALDLILEAASAAPDHHSLTPWRFVIVPLQERERLAEVFAASLIERDAAATPEEVAKAREKAHRAPLLMLVIVRISDADPDIPATERLLSTGCAIQNMLLMATALGYGSALTSGKALHATGLRRLFELAPDEHAVCFVSIGTVVSGKPARPRPRSSAYVRTLPAKP
jgi:nitroreductase